MNNNLFFLDSFRNLFTIFGLSEFSNNSSITGKMSGTLHRINLDSLLFDLLASKGRMCLLVFKK